MFVCLCSVRLSHVYALRWRLPIKPDDFISILSGKNHDGISEAKVWCRSNAYAQPCKIKPLTQLIPQCNRALTVPVMSSQEVYLLVNVAVNSSNGFCVNL